MYIGQNYSNIDDLEEDCYISCNKPLIYVKLKNILNAKFHFKKVEMINAMYKTRVRLAVQHSYPWKSPMEDACALLRIRLGYL